VALPDRQAVHADRVPHAGTVPLGRHPLYVGWLLAFWGTPTMTVTHLVFALVTTGYILTAIQFEERDLIDAFGDEYRNYRDRVPMLVPSLRTPAEEETAQSGATIRS
jgi:protein-S-isoprenylcysteine O-methyltransferase Ste14